MPDNKLTLPQLKQKATELQTAIDNLLSAFRRDTGYVPLIEVKIMRRQTNEGVFTKQNVVVTVEI